MVKLFVAFSAALDTMYLFEHNGAASGALVLIAYLVIFAIVDALGSLARRAGPRTGSTRSAA